MATGVISRSGVVSRMEPDPMRHRAPTLTEAEIMRVYAALPVGAKNAMLGRDLAIQLGWLTEDVRDDRAIETAKRRLRRAVQWLIDRHYLVCSDNAGYYRPDQDDAERLKRVAARYIAMGTRTLRRGRDLEIALTRSLHQGQLL